MLIAQSEITALIHLVDDPDKRIYNHVKDKILAYGSEAVPFLETAWISSAQNKVLQSRLEDIVHAIQYNEVVKKLQIWKEEGGESLLEGFVLVSRYMHPDISYDHIKRYLDKIKQDIWLELSPNLTAFEKIKVFNKVFFDIYGFKGNGKDYHSPRNSFINTVLESKKGNPLSLSMIYMMIALELDIPLKGINLPNHFVLGYLDASLSKVAGIEDSDIVFYINPYNRGAMLMNSDVEKFLTELKLPLKDEFMMPCSNKEMISRMISNLINAYRLMKDEQKTEELKTLRAMFL